MILELSAVMALAQQCAPSVAPETMASIAYVESRFNPYAIGVNRAAGLSRQPRNKAEAIATARALLAQGKNIDLGIGQINSNNLGWLRLTVEDAFDPCRNLSAASKVLTSNYQSVARSASSPQHALRLSVSMYNTGSQTRGFGNGYVRKVEEAAARLFGGRYVSPAPLQAPTQVAAAEQSSLAESAIERAEALTRTALETPPAPAWDVFARSQRNESGAAVDVFGGANL